MWSCRVCVCVCVCVCVLEGGGRTEVGDGVVGGVNIDLGSLLQAYTRMCGKDDVERLDFGNLDYI